MKKFFRFWAKPGPDSQPTSFYVYAEDLLAATEKVEQRLIDDYGGSAILTARVEEFDLQSCNQYARTSIAVSQSMTPDDVVEVCEDLDSVDWSTLDIPTRRIAQDFRFQKDTIQCRRGGQLVGTGTGGVNRRHR